MPAATEDTKKPGDDAAAPAFNPKLDTAPAKEEGKGKGEEEKKKP